MAPVTLGLGIGPQYSKTLIPPSESQEYSLYLDGASDRIQGGLTNSFVQDWGSNSSWTLKFSFKLDTLAASQTLLTAGSVANYIFISVATDGKLAVQTFASSSFTMNRIWTAGIAADTWYEVVITCDSSGTQRALVCYVNKVAKTLHTTSVSTSSTTLIPAAGKVTWGTFFNVVDYDYRIDSIASWSSVLTSAEVTVLFDAGPDLTADQHGYVSSDDLTSYYKIEEGSGTSLADSSGHAGTAALSTVNSPSWSTDTRL